MTIPVQVRIDEHLFDHIKRTARIRAAAEDRDIDWRDLIREALSEKFPLPKGQKNEEKGRLQK